MVPLLIAAVTDSVHTASISARNRDCVAVCASAKMVMKVILGGTHSVARLALSHFGYAAALLTASL